MDNSPERPPAGPEPSASASAPERKRLDRSLAGGVAWTAAAKWTSQVLSWAVMLVLARLLTPADFGLVGMATLYLGLVILVSEFGVGTAVVTLRDLSEEQLRQTNGLALGFGVAGALLSCALAEPLGKFFHSPRLPAVILVMSLTFLLTAVQSVPYGVLSRDLRFRLLAGINAGAAVGQSVLALVLALLGFGYWALVAGNVAKVALLAGLSFAFAPRRFAWPRVSSIRRVIRFSWHVIVSRASWYGYSNSDFLVAGRYLGEAPLGVYTIALNLASAPVEKITNLVTSVTPPVFAAVQHQHQELRRYLVRMTEGLALITFPATVGLALVAPDLVRVALGPKWLGATVPLELLALYATLRSIVTLLPQILIAIGDTRFNMWATVAMLVVLPPAFYVGSRWGTTGIAAGWVSVYPLLTLPLFYRVFRRIGMRLRDYLAGLWPAISASLVMAGSVALVKWLLPSTAASYMRLAVETGAGAVVYGAVLLTGHRQRALAIVGFAKSLRD